jgi:hypothetical protein
VAGAVYVRTRFFSVLKLVGACAACTFVFAHALVFRSPWRKAPKIIHAKRY